MSDERAPRARDWLHGGYGWDVGVTGGAAYSWAEVTLTEALNADTAWHAWWRPSRRRELWLLPMFTPNPATEPRVRRTFRTAEVVLDVDSACFEGLDRQGQARLARDHVRRFVSLAGERFRLGPVPPWPELPPVPQDLSEYEYVDDTPSRAEMREVFHEMGLKGDVEELLDGLYPGGKGDT